MCQAKYGNLLSKKGAFMVLPKLRVEASRLLPWVSLLTVWIFWGSTYLAIRAAVATIPPFLMAGSRYLLAGAVMLAIVGPRHTRAPHRPTWRQLRSVIIIGALLLVCGNGLVSFGETNLASGVAALIVATVPAWMVVIDALATRTRIAARTAVAVILGTVGVGMLIGGPGGHVNMGAAVIVLIASIFWAAGSVYARHAPLPTNPLLVTSMEMIAGGVLLIIAGIATGELGRLDPKAISTGSLLGLLWLVVAGSMLAFTAYVYANTHLPNDTVATYAYVNPLVAVVLGAILGQEPVGLNLLLGGGIILSAVVVIVGRRATRTVPRAKEMEGSSPPEPHMTGSNTSADAKPAGRLR